MHCSEIQENMSAYLDGELDPDEESLLKSHLEGCEACRGELESLRSTVELVRSVPRVQAPPVLKHRLSSATSFRRPAWRFLNPLALASAAALVLVAAVAIFMLTSEHPGDVGNLAVSQKENDEAAPSKRKASSGPTTRAAIEKKHESEKKAAELRPGKHEAYAVKEERYRAKGTDALRKLAPKTPARLPDSDKAPGGKINRETLGDADSEEGYEKLASKLKVVERRSGDAKPLAPQEAPAPPSIPGLAEKAQEVIPEAEELADRGDGDTRKVIIETRDPAGTAAQVSKILSAHIGKKGVLAGAVLDGFAKASEESESDAENSLEITVYVDREKSGEIIAQLQSLKKQTTEGWAGNALGEPAEEKNKEREPESPAGEAREKLQESQRATKDGVGQAGRTGLSKKGQEQENIPEKKMPRDGTEPDKNFGRSDDSSQDNMKKRTDLEKKDEKVKQPEEARGQQTAIIIKIVRAKPVPDNLLKKALEKEAGPDPAAKGK